MISFHRSHALKQEMSDWLVEAIDYDKLKQGLYWDGRCGCLVGMLLMGQPHAAITEHLGLPVWLAYLADLLFESQPSGKSGQFAVDFVESIPVGVSLEKAKRRILDCILAEHRRRVRDEGIPERLKADCLRMLIHVAADGFAVIPPDARLVELQAMSLAWQAPTWTLEAAARTAAAAARANSDLFGADMAPAAALQLTLGDAEAWVRDILRCLSVS
jgi:hypothetical protein